jgi:hypothetical protein
VFRDHKIHSINSQVSSNLWRAEEVADLIVPWTQTRIDGLWWNPGKQVEKVVFEVSVWLRHIIRRGFERVKHAPSPRPLVSVQCELDSICQLNSALLNLVRSISFLPLKDNTLCRMQSLHASSSCPFPVSALRNPNEAGSHMCGCVSFSKKIHQ